jgi:dihydroorotate dehydrogenase
MSPPSTAAARNTDAPVLRTRLFDWDLANPVLIASGPLTSSSRAISKMLRAGAGGVVTKSIVPTADTRQCRCFREGQLLFNRDGYSQHSVEMWEEELDRHRADPIIANIVADTPEELATLAVRVTRAGARVLELGLSCPTLDEDPVCCDPAKLEAFCRAVRRAVDVPLVVKLLISTSAAANREMARIAHATGMNGLTVADTVPALLLDQRTSRPVLGGPGGASGPFLKALVLKAITDVRGLGLEILGCGGVMNARDALDYMDLGCRAVQVCTLIMNESYHSIRPLLSQLETELASRAASAVSTGAVMSTIGAQS